jgi:hypothetical protein
MDYENYSSSRIDQISEYSTRPLSSSYAFRMSEDVKLIKKMIDDMSFEMQEISSAFLIVGNRDIAEKIAGWEQEILTYIDILRATSDTVVDEKVKDIQESHTTMLKNFLTW